jgi:hypothetical protein
MLAFADNDVYNTDVTKMRFMNPGSVTQKVLMLTVDEDAASAVLHINGVAYFLVPEEMPNGLEDLQQMLRAETVEVYMNVVEMLRELAQ